MTPAPDSFLAVGALLARASRPRQPRHARCGHTSLDPTEENRAVLAATGVDTDDARDFLQLLPNDPDGVERICELARAWALGRSSHAPAPSWQPVVTSGEVDATASTA